MRKFITNKLLPIAVVIIIAAPIIINLGLCLSDYIYNKFGCSLTADGLNNENWLDFWKDYTLAAITLFGIYMVWNTANKDREQREREQVVVKKLEDIEKEKSVLTNIIKVFNIESVSRAILGTNTESGLECRFELFKARERMNSAHVDFEMNTKLCENFEEQYDESGEKAVTKNLIATREMFYDLERKYLEMLSHTEKYLEYQQENCTSQKIYDINKKLSKNLERMIQILSNTKNNSEELICKKGDLEETYRKMKESEEHMHSNDELYELTQNIIKCSKELLGEKGIPMFTAYCKSYIEYKKKNVLEESDIKCNE